MIVSLEISLSPHASPAAVVPTTSDRLEGGRHLERLNAVFPETPHRPVPVVGFWADRVGPSVDMADVEANLVRQATLMIQEAVRRVRQQRSAPPTPAPATPGPTA